HMQRGDLVLLDDKNFFAVELSAPSPKIGRISVTQREKNESDTIEIATPEICDVPSELSRDYFADLTALSAPVIRSPVGEGGKHEPIFFQECIGSPDSRVYFRSFHRQTVDSASRTEDNLQNKRRRIFLHANSYSQLST